MASSAHVNNFNKTYLHAIGKDGRYNRDRLFQQIGVAPTAAGDYSTVSLSDDQRKAMKAAIERETGQRFDGLDIDTAGNLNEPTGFGHYAKQAGKYGAIGGAALTGIGALGIGPLAGVLGGIGGGAAGAAGTAASTAGTGAAGTAAAAGGGGGMGLWSSLGSGALNFLKGGGAEAAANMLGGAAETAAQNRGSQLEAMLAQEAIRSQQKRDYQDGMLARERDGRESADDALAKVMRAQYVQNNKGYTPQNGLPTFGFEPKASTAAEIDAAKLLEAEGQDRLKNGNRVPMPDQSQFTIDDDLLHAGAMENIGNWGGSAMGLFDAIMRTLPGKK